MEAHNIDFNAMVLKMKKPWLRNPEKLKAILGLSFLEIETVQEIKKIYYQYANEKTTGSKKKMESVEFRWMYLSQRDVDEAIDLRAAQKAWEEAPIGSYIKENALLKILDLATTYKRIMGIYSSSPHGSLIQKKALQKLTTFFEV